MQFINQLRARFGTKKFIITLIAAVAAIYFVFFSSKAVTEETVATNIPMVTTSRVGSLVGGGSFTTVGTVEAVSEAELHAEAGGRVIAVYPALGSTVAAGTIIARLEGSMQSAAMLQAQGAYEAALAGAASGNIGVDQATSMLTAAQNGAVSAEHAAYTTISTAFYTNLSDIFDDPLIKSPSFIAINSTLPFLQSEGRAFKELLPAWQTSSAALSTASDLDAALASAETTTTRVIRVVDNIIALLNERNADTMVANATVAQNLTNLSALRGTLNGTLASLKAARVGLKDARDMKAKAELGGTNGEVSGANAQVKIALGSLRAAQAAYEKTLVRTPITGVVNALYLKAGEYAAPGARAALIANNQGLEIKTSISQDDALQLQVGDVVTIDNTATGTISQIAGAIDPSTGKVAIKISINENGTLQNGATVAIAFSANKEVTAKEISIPLAAIKMTGSGPVVFSVDESSTLVATPVTLGAISGENVVVTNGITTDSVIVVDGRGLKAGTKVTVTAK